MKKMIMVMATTLLCLFTTSLFASGQKALPHAKTVNPQGYNEVVVKNFKLQWKIVASNLEIIISAPTSGWIAVGFDPSDKMKDANVIIGYVKDGAVFIRDDYGNTQINHQADSAGGGRDDILEKAGKEENGATEIRFVIPLDSKDARDRSLTPGKEYKIIIASGNDDNFDSYHKDRVSLMLVL